MPDYKGCMAIRPPIAIVHPRANCARECICLLCTSVPVRRPGPEIFD